MDQGDIHGAPFPLHVPPFNCHSCVDQSINFKTFIKHLCARPHQHFLLGIVSIRPRGGKGGVGVEGRERI